jgi:hypothetical protein
MYREYVYLIPLAISGMLLPTACGSVIYNNLTPNTAMAAATRPSATEIETADDFVATATQTLINSASFTGLFVGGTGSPSISQVVIEIYRVFPLDSNTVRTPNVPTRVNSPSDIAFDSRDSGAGGLLFSSTVISSTVTATNSVQPGGIHASPNQTTGGNGAVTGNEVQIDVTFNTPFTLPPDHYFFVPQVTLTNGAQYYWLSASRPISGSGTTPFPAGFNDLQAWTRDANLDPDWLRIGTDIVGGPTPPTFNMAFALNGTAVPEPGTAFVVLSGLALLGAANWRRRRA